MKRIIIIFIIVFCLLSFVGASYAAEKYISPGEYWNGLTKLDTLFDKNGVGISELSDFVKEFYIKGIGAGVFLTLDLINNDKLYLEKIRDYSFFILKNNREIMEIMDDLYKDPANVKIKIDWMCKVAISKLTGGDIKSSLEVGRYLGTLLEGD